jgi:hypothetical protein
MLFRDIHSKLITQYDCKEVCAPSQSQVNTGTGDRNSSQDGRKPLLACPPIFRWFDYLMDFEKEQL